MNLKISSKGMYSTWGYYAPIRALFDCGEGCATNLGNYVYAPESVFLGHNHGDHVLGLPSFVGCRNSARGDKEKPLTVYYPESDMMKDLIEFIMKRNSRLSYELKFVEIAPGFKMDFGNKMHLEAFYVKHGYNSLGFRIMEKRSRLKAGVNPKDAKNLIAKGEIISEEYFGNVFTWTLDSARYDLSNIENCAHLVADATFIKVADRDNNTHTSVDEVMTWAKEANVKTLTLAHFSSRYNWNEITPSVLDIKEKIGFNGNVNVVLPNKVYEF
jgi:ribonuclease Z